MKTKKNTVKLTEGELKKIISESVKRVLKENAAFDVQDNLLESFDELKNALMEIRDVYSFDDYLENLSFAIQSACRVINELTALNNNR